MSDPRWLILETSSKAGEVALAEGPRLISVQALAAAKRNASDLALTVSEMLAGAGWAPRSLQGVVVGHGPGSFTSLRVGIASAKTVAYALGVPLYAVPTLRTIAEQASPGTRDTWVILDALQGQVYSARFRREQLDWEEVEPVAIRPLEEVLRQLTPATTLVGSGVGVYRDRLPEGVVVEAEEAWRPRCATLLQLVLGDPAGHQADPWLLEPVYLRRSSAEEKRAATLAAAAKLLDGPAQ